MGNFSGAGRDPIFWLHHCNIDRLWEKWLSQGGGRTNPIANTTWMNKTSTFADVNGSFVTMRNSDVLSTVSQLNYQYDDPSKCVPLIIATQFARNAKIQNVRVVNTMNANAEGQNIAQKIKPDLS